MPNLNYEKMKRYNKKNTVERVVHTSGFFGPRYYEEGSYANPKQKCYNGGMPIEEWRKKWINGPSFGSELEYAAYILNIHDDPERLKKEWANYLLEVYGISENLGTESQNNLEKSTSKR